MKIEIELFSEFTVDNYIEFLQLIQFDEVFIKSIKVINNDGDSTGETV